MCGNNIFLLGLPRTFIAKQARLPLRSSSIMVVLHVFKMSNTIFAYTGDNIRMLQSKFILFSAEKCFPALGLWPGGLPGSWIY